jgi:arginyl-tRNA synthetase
MPTPLVRDDLAALLATAVESAQRKGLIPRTALPSGPIERPSNPAHGDYASTIALKLARAAQMNPQQIARILVDELPAAPMVERVNLAGPGFINFALSDRWLAEQVDRILALGAAFGTLDLGRGALVQVEFVSANPTGPLPAAAGRGGALGDSLARVLCAAGYRVQREYYVNDHGNQVAAFGQSLLARYAQAFGRDVPVPPGGYQGEYLAELAQHLKATEGDRYLGLPAAEAATVLGRVGIAHFLRVIKDDLDRLGIVYDRWFSEASLYENGEVGRILDVLRDRGFVATREGAIWFVSSTLGEDKDNVLVRSNGEPTYFASDVAYHYNKLVERGFDRVIDVWGADHQGHVSRTRTGVGALGIDPDRLRIIIHQMVTLKINGQPVRMSKRSGNIVTLKEVLDEVGPDACRFFFVSRSADSHLDFDLDLARLQSDENPVFYVQYAHARMAGILRTASAVSYSDGDASLLTQPAELSLIRKMLELPELVEAAATAGEPHHLPHYASELAAVFHGQFYEQCRVLPRRQPGDTRPLAEVVADWVTTAPAEELAITKARLKLVAAAQITLRNALDLIGVSAPEQMTRADEVESVAP